MPSSGEHRDAKQGASTGGECGNQGRQQPSLNPEPTLHVSFWVLVCLQRNDTTLHAPHAAQRHASSRAARAGKRVSRRRGSSPGMCMHTVHNLFGAKSAKAINHLTHLGVTERVPAISRSVTKQTALFMSACGIPLPHVTGFYSFNAGGRWQTVACGPADLFEAGNE